MSWIAGLFGPLCISGLLTGILLFMAPSGACEKPVRIFMSVLILSLVLSAAAGLRDTDISFEIADSVLENPVNDETLKVFADAAAQSLGEKLQEAGYEVRDVQITAGIDEDGTVFIEKVRISLDALGYAPAISGLTQDVLGIEPEFELASSD